MDDDPNLILWGPQALEEHAGHYHALRIAADAKACLLTAARVTTVSDHSKAGAVDAVATILSGTNGGRIPRQHIGDRHAAPDDGSGFLGCPQGHRLHTGMVESQYPDALR